jgi:hypothetical protein
LEIQLNGFSISFPFDMDDKYNQFEMQSKGYLSSTVLKIENGDMFILNFYEPARFKHDIDEILKMYTLYYGENIVFIEDLTKENVLAAIHYIFNKKLYKKMVLIELPIDTE